MKPSFRPSDYERAFGLECANAYPGVDAFEERMGHAIDRRRLEGAARTLACPVKVNPPNWAHGRVLYAALRNYLAGRSSYVNIFDCGTAKGFSALCMAFALADARGVGRITSVDVIDPEACVPRNSVLDCERLRTVYEFVAPWEESDLIQFHRSTGIDWLKAHDERIHFAFVDGKHSYEVVREEAVLLSERQQSGDIVIFDDVQIRGVHEAVLAGTQGYRVSFIEAKPERRYAMAVRS